MIQKEERKLENYIKKPSKQVRLLFFNSYIATIKNGVDSKIFQTLYAEVDGEKKDIIEGGKKACALFVSGVLQWFGLVKTRHATVLGTIADMKSMGWIKIDKPRVGCVIHWEEVQKNGEANEHIGFYIGERRAISNGSDERVIIEHHWTYGVKESGEPTRKIIGLYWNARLEDKYF